MEGPSDGIVCMHDAYYNAIATCIQYIKILLVCLCVTDVGVAVTNLRVVCEIITCASAFPEMAGHNNNINLS